MQIQEMEVYSLEEAGRYLKVSTTTLARMIKSNQIKTAKVGKQYRILGRELLRLVSPNFQTSTTELLTSGTGAQAEVRP